MDQRRNEKQLDLRCHGQRLMTGRRILIGLVNDKLVAEIVVAATNGNGNFVDKAQRVRYLETLLVEIREKACATGAMKHHAGQDNQNYCSSHGTKIASKFCGMQIKGLNLV